MLPDRRKNAQQQSSKVSEIEELSRLTGGLAHEIKNPLSTIKVNLKLISEDEFSGFLRATKATATNPPNA